MIRHAISRTGLARATWAAALAALAGTLGFAGSAAAATTKSTTITSSNWSGYAAHGSSTTFKAVSGRWRIPSASCEKGEQSFSSFWVGIGGYNENSTGLEQDGTELDCNADGTQTVSAWYELLPAAPHTISLKVASGDLMSASVHIRGKAVTMTIKDLTTRQSFSKTVTDGDIDDTSVEWITEAPSDCSSNSDCDVLPLADFGSVRFSNASATTTTGVSSNIETGKWTTTKLLLGYKEDSADDFVADTDSGDATPSALTDDDSEFTVTWSGTETSSGSTGSAGSSGSGSSGSGSGSSGSSGSGSSGSGGAPSPGGGGYGGGGSGGGPGGGGPGGGGPGGF